MLTFFITANDTEVGKTYVTGLLARYFAEREQTVQIVKAIECGSSGDAEWAQTFADSNFVTAQTLLHYPEPLAPLAKENASLSPPTLTEIMERLTELPEADVRLIEGAGGIAVPIDPAGQDWRDLIDHILPDLVIVVLDNRLGSINQSRLLHSYLDKRSHAFVLNEVKPVDSAVNTSNLDALKNHALPLLGCLRTDAKAIDFHNEHLLAQNPQSPSKELTKVEDPRIQQLEKRKQIAGFRQLKTRFSDEPTLNLSDNDILGLRFHPNLIEAAQTATAQWGTSSSASPLISGYTAAHAELEANLSNWYKGRPTLVWNSGYAAKQAILKLFVDRNDLILADRLIHNSLINGALQTGARLIRFQHNDPEHLESLLKQHAGRRKIHLVTESVYSMDGDYPDLEQIAQLKSQYSFTWFLDEAHAVGWYGQTGSGLAETSNILEQVDILVGTLGKALAASGAYTVFSAQWMRDYCINEAGEFIYSTYLPPASAASANAAIQLVRKHPEWRTVAQAKAFAFRQALRDQGWNVPGTESAIVPIICGASESALMLSKELLQAGIQVGAIRPPTVPQGQARIRLTLKSTLTDRDYSHIQDCFQRSRTHLENE